MKKNKLIIFLVFCSSVKVFAQDALLEQEKPSYEVHAVIMSESKATISSPIAGYIEHLYIKDGSHFKKGELLLQFDCRLQNYALKMAEAKLKESEVNQQAYARLAQLDSASNMKVAESEAELTKAQSDRDTAAYEQEHCQIKAPYDGQITELYVHTYETVQLYQKVFDILDNQSLIVKVLAPSDWTQWLKKGDQFNLTINETGKTYPVTIVRIVGMVDAVSQSIKIIGSFNELPGELNAGMSGKAIFAGPKHE